MLRVVTRFRQQWQDNWLIGFVSNKNCEVLKMRKNIKSLDFDCHVRESEKETTNGRQDVDTVCVLLPGRGPIKLVKNGAIIIGFELRWEERSPQTTHEEFKEDLLGTLIPHGVIMMLSDEIFEVKRAWRRWCLGRDGGLGSLYCTLEFKVLWGLSVPLKMDLIPCGNGDAYCISEDLTFRGIVRCCQKELDTLWLVWRVLHKIHR